jgi:hypothetical protein
MQIEQIIKELESRLNSHEIRISQLESSFQTKPAVEIKKLSIKEFILGRNTKDDQQKTTLAIGYFLEKFKNYDSFNIKDIEQGFRDAKIKPPQNINDKVNKNIAKGFIMETEGKKDNKKAWVLTATGEGIMDNNFKED